MGTFRGFKGVVFSVPSVFCFLDVATTFVFLDIHSLRGEE